MSTLAGLLNHQVTAGQALTRNAAAPMASSTSGSSGANSSSDSSGSSATISANDFLTLLVTEMQNQDPTADTDPNEYINQLVNVNSLEQLIDINQNLSTALGDSSTSSSSSAGAQTAQTAPGIASPSALSGGAATKANVLASAQSALASAGTANGVQSHSSATSRTSGNLSVPNASSAAHRVAHALDGRTHSQSNSAALSANGSSL